MLTYVDIFAGAGGLSEGFMRNGFAPLAHVESDENACLTLKTRACYYFLKRRKKMFVYYNYMKGLVTRDELYDQVPSFLLDQIINKEISARNMTCVLNAVRSNMRRVKAKRVDILVGGPPCQPFSIVGRGALNQTCRRETRANLYRFFSQFLRELTPRMFVFENVPGLLSAKNGKTFARLLSSIKAVGYHVEYKILNAYDFGVMQRRNRVVLIGWPKDETGYAYPVFTTKRNGYVVAQLFSDLPSVLPGQDGSACGYRAAANQFLQKTRMRVKSDILTLHVTRPHNDRDRKIYSLAISMWNKEKRRLKYTNLPSRLQTRKNKTAFLDRFKVVAADLSCSHTLLAHIAKDGHYYIHPDDSQLRSLSVREAARIQSFPDNYFFEGSRSSGFRQIGNAVPPIMAERIARAMRRHLS